MSWPVAGVVVLSFVAITVFGSVLSTCPAVWRLPVAAVAGLVNAWLWVRLVARSWSRPVTRLRVPVVPVGVAGVFVLVIVGTVAGFVLSSHPVTRLVAPAAEAATEWTPAAVATATTPLIVVTGFNTQWDGVPSQSVHLAVPQRRFSYRGIDDDRPLPYGRDDTHRSIRALVGELRRQVDAYHRDTDEPITLVAESEGALLAKAYVAATPHAPVRNLVVVSPLVEPGRVYYPPADGEGWGVFGKFEMEGLSWALGGLSPVGDHAGHAVPALDRRRRARVQHPDVMPVAGRAPGRRPPARHRRRARPRRGGSGSPSRSCPGSTAACSTTHRRRRSSSACSRAVPCRSTRGGR